MAVHRGREVLMDRQWPHDHAWNYPACSTDSKQIAGMLLRSWMTL